MPGEIVALGVPGRSKDFALPHVLTGFHLVTSASPVFGFRVSSEPFVFENCLSLRNPIRISEPIPFGSHNVGR